MKNQNRVKIIKKEIKSRKKILAVWCGVLIAITIATPYIFFNFIRSGNLLCLYYILALGILIPIAEEVNNIKNLNVMLRKEKAKIRIAKFHTQSNSRRNKYYKRVG